MKTNEFKEKLEDNGFSVMLINDNPEEFAIHHGGICVGYVIKNFPYHMSITNYFAEMGENLRVLLLDTLYEYARTPVEERENEKKYYLVHKWFCDGVAKYLCYDRFPDEYFLYNRRLPDDKWQIEFTKKEIEEIKERFGTDLKDYEMIEVGI